MDTTSTKSSKINSAVVLVIGGIIILFIISLTTKFFPKTGVKTDLKDIEKGKLTFTDTKTGQTVNVGYGRNYFGSLIYWKIFGECIR